MFFPQFQVENEEIYEHWWVDVFLCLFVFASERFSISNSFLSATEISTRETLASLHRHPLQSFMLKATSINLGLRVLLAFVFFKCSLVSPLEPQEKYKLTSFGICNNHNRSERLPLLIITFSCLRGLCSRRKPHNLIISQLSQTPQASSRRKCARDEFWNRWNYLVSSLCCWLAWIKFDVIIHPSVSWALTSFSLAARN